MSFSERHGYKDVKSVVQRESMDEDLRVAIWNVLDLAVWSSATKYDDIKSSGMYPMAVRLWASEWRRAVDTLPGYWSHLRLRLRGHDFDASWFAVYDFLEFLVNDESQDGQFLSELLNGALESNLSAYRIAGGRVAEITAPEELSAIEDALAVSDPGVRTHIATALDKLADRENPDYRNSIKESISAVEVVANRVAGTSHKSLGDAMKAMNLDLHGALDGAFRQLYGYTSNAGGIRHALMDEQNLEFEDAKFMLVACSAFVNYLVAKAARAGVAV